MKGRNTDDFKNSGKLSWESEDWFESGENTTFGYEYIGFIGWQRTNHTGDTDSQIYKHIYI